jgi:hypothetical protein
LVGAGHQELPEEIGALTNLRALHLEKNGISSLPASLARLTRLGHLNISANRFEGALPPIVLAITSLTTLDIACNRFTRLCDDDQAFGQLTKLRVLNAGNNRLEALPDELWRLPRVRCLQIKGNAPLLAWIQAREQHQVDRAAGQTPATADEQGKGHAENVVVADEDTERAVTARVEEASLTTEEEKEEVEVMQGWMRKKKKKMRRKDWWAIAKKNLRKSVQLPQA